MTLEILKLTWKRCRRNSSCQQARLLLMVTFSHGQTPLWPLMIGINLYIYVSKTRKRMSELLRMDKVEIALNPKRFMRVRIQQVLTKPIIYIICIPCWICFPLPLVLAQSRKMQKSPSLMDIRVRLKSTRQTMTDNLQSTSVHRLRVGTLLMELFQKECSLSLMTATIVSICKERSVLHLIILERNTNLLFVQSLLLQ